MQTVWTIVSLMPDTPAPSQLPAQMPQPPTSATSPAVTPQSCQQGTDGAYFPIPTPTPGKGKGGGSSPTLSCLWRPVVMGGGAIVVESWQRQPAAARESGKNDIKPRKMQAGWRAQAGPGR